VNYAGPQSGLPGDALRPQRSLLSRRSATQSGAFFEHKIPYAGSKKELPKEVILLFRWKKPWCGARGATHDRELRGLLHTSSSRGRSWKKKGRSRVKKVIDLRTLLRYDRETILARFRKKNKLLAYTKTPAPAVSPVKSPAGVW